jgi:hypothetical protein
MCLVDEAKEACNSSIPVYHAADFLKVDRKRDGFTVADKVADRFDLVPDKDALYEHILSAYRWETGLHGQDV